MIKNGDIGSSIHITRPLDSEGDSLSWRMASEVKWAYYNDADEEKCGWVRELIKRRIISDGEVDSRPIQSVTADDVRGFRRAHFFCGIAVLTLLCRAGARPRRLGWAYSIEKTFDLNPLIDRHGKRMRWISRIQPNPSYYNPKGTKP
jgi:hypothetical protein